MPSLDPASATNGAAYIVTGMEPYGDWQTRIHLLLPSGRRRSVVLNGTVIAPEILDAVAAGLEADDIRMRPGRPRRLSEPAAGD